MGRETTRSLIETHRVSAESDPTLAQVGEIGSTVVEGHPDSARIYPHDLSKKMTASPACNNRPLQCLRHRTRPTSLAAAPGCGSTRMQVDLQPAHL